MTVVAGGLLIACALVASAGSAAGGRKPGPSPSPAATPSSSPIPSFRDGEGSVTGVVAVSPVTIALELSRASTGGGQRMQATVVVVNQARNVVSNVTISVLASPEGVTTRPVRDRQVRRLDSGAATASSWTICGTRAGTYSIVGRATVAGSTITSTPASLVVTTASRC